MDKDTKQALEIIKRGSDEIIPEDAFKKPVSYTHLTLPTKA